MAQTSEVPANRWPQVEVDQCIERDEVRIHIRFVGNEMHWPGVPGLGSEDDLDGAVGSVRGDGLEHEGNRVDVDLDTSLLGGLPYGAGSGSLTITGIATGQDPVFEISTTP